MKLAWIDLTKKDVHTTPYPKTEQKRLLGGRGTNIDLLFKLTTPETDPFAPENPLLITPGLLTGFAGPSSARCSIGGISPETGLLGDANIGGKVPARIASLGYQSLIIQGQLAQPGYLYLSYDEISIHLDDQPWGMDVYQTIEYFKELYPTAEVMCIGPAGEQEIPFASIRSGLKSAAGRTGLGALMGNKKLKAIVVEKVPPRQPVHKKEYYQLVRKINQLVIDTGIKKILGSYGTSYLYDLHNYLFQHVRTKNGQLNRFEDGRELSIHAFAQHFLESKGCYGCNIKCRHRYKVKGETGEGPEYTILGLFGPACGISNREEILEINTLLNRLGLDASSTGNLVAWTIELAEKKLIPAEYLDPEMRENLTWGNAEAVIQLINDLVAKRGLGKLLALGGKRMGEILGPEAGKLLVQGKDLPQSDPVDLRTNRGFALGVATSSRGADHLRSRPTLEAMGLKPDKLADLYGRPVSNDPTSYEGKAWMVAWTEREYAIVDSLGVCKFISIFNNPDLLQSKDFAELANAALDLGFDEESLHHVGERINHLERLFLNRRGINGKDDTLPERYFEPAPAGKIRGTCLDHAEFDQMKQDFYQLKGWDQAGQVTPEVISKYNLENYLPKG